MGIENATQTPDPESHACVVAALTLNTKQLAGRGGKEGGLCTIT